MVKINVVALAFMAAATVGVFLAHLHMGLTFRNFKNCVLDVISLGLIYLIFQGTVCALLLLCAE